MRAQFTLVTLPSLIFLPTFFSPSLSPPSPSPPSLSPPSLSSPLLPSLSPPFLSPQGSASLVLWYGGYLVWHGSLQPGTLIALMLYTLNLAMCFAFLSNLYGEFMQVGHSIAIIVAALMHSSHMTGTWVLRTMLCSSLSFRL